MAQHRPHAPEGLGSKRTSSEDNLYLAVLRASEGKKGGIPFPPGRTGWPSWKGPLPGAGSWHRAGWGRTLRL